MRSQQRGGFGSDAEEQIQESHIPVDKGGVGRGIVNHPKYFKGDVANHAPRSTVSA
jgi:hypothetical protein